MTNVLGTSPLFESDSRGAYRTIGRHRPAPFELFPSFDGFRAEQDHLGIAWGLCAQYRIPASLKDQRREFFRTRAVGSTASYWARFGSRPLPSWVRSSFFGVTASYLRVSRHAAQPGSLGGVGLAMPNMIGIHQAAQRGPRAARLVAIMAEPSKPTDVVEFDVRIFLGLTKDSPCALH